MICSSRWHFLLVPILLGMLFGCGTANVQHRAALEQVAPGEVAPEKEAPAVNPPDRVVRESVLQAGDVREELVPEEETVQESAEAEQPAQPRQAGQPSRGAPNLSWTMRTVTDEELETLSRNNPAISVIGAWDILARLNTVARYYIPEAIRHKEPLKVPNDFDAYKDWSPLPRYIPDLAGTEKFILIVKDHPFLGWYSRGLLMEDTQICVGKKFTWTRAGTYSVKEKDATHVSRSYPNAFGQPSPMPWALRIYETVWIHAGDITEGFCSHGCINVPIKTAKRLFHWAETGTAVMVVDSVDDLGETLARNRSNCVLFASACR